MLKEFLMKQALKSQMKDVPPAQADMILSMIEKNPKLFEQIAKEIKEETEKGKEKNLAAFEVMNRYKSELTKIAGK